MQAAVPNTIQLRLDFASGIALGTRGSSSAMQNLHVTNTMHRINQRCNSDNC